MSPPVFAPLTVQHWPEIEAIYAEGIATGHATFEESPPTWERFDHGKLPDQRFVASDSAGAVLGWVAASATSDRPVYAGVVEHSVYVASAARGRRVGTVLLAELIRSTEAAGIWTIQSGIFPENRASRQLHRAAGFRTIGTREAIGLMTYGQCAGQWRDVLMIERRSAVVFGPRSVQT